MTDERTEAAEPGPPRDEGGTSTDVPPLLADRDNLIRDNERLVRQTRGLSREILELKTKLRKRFWGTIVFVLVALVIGWLTAPPVHRLCGRLVYTAKVKVVRTFGGEMPKPVVQDQQTDQEPTQQVAGQPQTPDHPERHPQPPANRQKDPNDLGGGLTVPQGYRKSLDR